MSLGDLGVPGMSLGCSSSVPGTERGQDAQEEKENEEAACREVDQEGPTTQHDQFVRKAVPHSTDQFEASHAVHALA